MSIFEEYGTFQETKTRRPEYVAYSYVAYSLIAIS